MNIFKEKIIKTTAQVAIVSFVVVLLLGIQITVAADNNTNENVDNGSENVEEDMTSDEAEEEDSAIIDLNSQIEQRKRELDKLNNEHEKYRKSISIKQQEAITLESQLSTLDDNISKTEIDIQITETEIDTLKLQIREVDNKIAEREKQIDDQKDKLSALIRQLNTTKDTNLLEILLKEDKFSEFFNQVNYLEELEHGLKGSLDDVKQLKLDLEIIDEDLAIKNEELNEKKDRLDTEIVDLDSQKDYKIDLLDETKSNEADFQELLNTVKREQMSISSEIDIIEDTIRKKLEGGDLLSADDSATLSWPVSPVGGITAYFHDPSYPFRYIFEHPAIDLRASQGTPVKAAASGYVARAKDSGMGYSYIMIIHSDGISTVYGHISSIKVEEETFVTRGQVIGLSGGMPGTSGAGRLTTGAHLHFEVRLDGIPVNPLDYLP